MRRFPAGLIALLLALPQGQARAQQTGNPHGSIREACATCHQSESWKTVRISPAFVHAARTFPLGGAHARVACMTCHRSPEFQKTSATCASCHSDVHKGELGTECARCHSTRSFVDRATMQQAHALTRFPLRGAHAAAACTDCHAPTPAGQAQFVNKSTQCFSCHAADFRRATSPNHEGAKFSTDCGSCHTISTWSGAKFDHSKTLFPLTGAHLAQLCGACHADRVFQGRSTTCVSCHQTDYDRSANPPHGGFPTTCASCHTTAAWKGATFDHAADTKYPLTGAHLAATCADCHSDGVYSGKPTTCVACHQADYNKTLNPQHSTLGFPTACQSCHTTAQWRGATFDHGLTAFPLTGAHRAVTCNDCHAGGVYKGTPVACASCHKAVYDASTNPHHAPAGFSTLCQSCHATNPGWKPATFDHSATRFALTGAHIAQICAACHADKVYAGKPTTCVSCHLVDYNNTTSPKHSAVGYPTDCQSCHTTSQWPGANFNHSATAFPLLGAHLAVACADCHVNNVYKGTSTTCASCHQTDFNNSTSPHHVQAGFTTQCLTCHTMNAGWKPATFDHSKTLFPLTGAHIAQICSACHADKVYAGKPTSCVSCHLADYNATLNPNHKAAFFPTTCASCHTTTQWLGATFNHDGAWFPIYSGSHLGRWSTCADCHTNSSNYKVFECITCHTHDKTTTDGHHSSVPGYQYLSTACYACHPRGTH